MRQTVIQEADLHFDAQVIVSKNEDPLTVKLSEAFYNVIDIIWNMFR